MNLNLLEPSGPVQACNGIALPFLCSSNLFTKHIKKFQLITEIRFSLSSLFCKNNVIEVDHRKQLSTVSTLTLQDHAW